MKKTLALFLSLILAITSACAAPPVTDEWGRQEIVLAVVAPQNWFDIGAYQEVVDTFMQKNPDYYITVVNYLGDYTYRAENGDLDPNYGEALAEAEKQLNIDLTVKAKNRKTPDIIVTDFANNNRYREFARAGVLADLTGYYERDIERAAVFDKVFEALKTEGKLYGITEQFAPRGIYMDQQFAGLDRSLTAMLALQRESDYPLLANTYSQRFFDSWLSLYGREFVDWETYKSGFDSPGFTALLELMENIPEATGEGAFFSIANKAVSERKPFFVYKGVTIAEYQVMSSFFGGNMAFASFPSADKLEMFTSDIWAVAANSRHKEAAWACIRELVSEEYQENHVNTERNRTKNTATRRNGFSMLPVSRKALELELADFIAAEGLRELDLEIPDIVKALNLQAWDFATVEELEALGYNVLAINDANTPEVLEALGVDIADVIAAAGDERESRPAFIGAEATEAPHFEPALLASFKNLLEQDMKVFSRDEAVDEILYEEVAAYRGGFISREKMIDNLNNRVQLYLNEIKP
jgi:ABC-type glycerol-3-phosphate transport system substrate-binding protein